jgi:hypothetical protein
MEQKIIVTKPGYDADTDTNPDHMIFSSDYNTLKYSAANGTITLDVDTQVDGVYRVEQNRPHGLGYIPYFKAYVYASFIGFYVPVGSFSLVDENANAAFNVSVDAQNIRFIATGMNIPTRIDSPGGGGTSLDVEYAQMIADHDLYYWEYSDSSNLYQCVDVVEGWAQAYLGIPKTSIQHASAYQIYTEPTAETYKYFDIIPNDPSNFPRKGDIVVWSSNVPGSGGNGHTGVATGDGNTDQFDCFEQNDPTGSACHIKTYTYTNVLGWLRPKGYGDILGGGATSTYEPHHLQYSVTFKYKIFKNKLGL